LLAAACWRLGAVFAPVGAGLAGGESGGGPSPRHARARCWRRARTGPAVLAGAIADPAPAPEPGPAPGDALLLLTSGSTGRPKAVILTRAGLAAGTRAVAATFELSEGDATLALLPWTHGHGLIGVLAATAATGGSVLMGATGSALAAAEPIARAG